MCGFAGIVLTSAPGEPARAVPDAWIEALDDAVAWRGPDGAGVFRDEAARPDGSTVRCALVHRRLSIIDPDGGAQPMVDPGRAASGESLVAVVFNGCVYNNAELRAELEAEGRPFASDHSDTETLLVAYRAFAADLDDPAPALASRLRGMYGAAVWERARARVTLLRDPFGEKPLYVAEPAPGAMVFASVASGVARAARLIAGDRAAPTDAAAAAEWLARGALDGATPWRAVAQLTPTRPITSILPGEPPAEPRPWRARVLGAALRPRAARAPLPGRLAPALDRVDRALRASVESRLEADVPVGCFLSGGVDSSLVALHAREALGRLTTVCVRMPDAGLDESAHAERVAAAIGAEHVTIDAPSEHAADDLVRLVRLLGLPFGDSSLLPTFWVCRAARSRMKVALSGDGGDELFAGYDRYAGAAILGRRRALVGRGLGSLGGALRRERLRRFGVAWAGEGYADLVSVFPSEFPLAGRDGEGDAAPPRFEGAGAARAHDLGAYLPADLLRKVDTASLATGLEVRCPFLDPDLGAEALAIPIRDHMFDGRPKALLRALAARRLPAEVAGRPKRGFAAPIGAWFRSDEGGLRTLLERRVAGPAERGEPPFDAPIIDAALALRLVREHLAGRRDHAQRLFGLCTLAIWAQDGAPGAVTPPPAPTPRGPDRPAPGG